MVAAFLEWFLWLAAFDYCLVKVFQKAEHWSIKVLAVVVMIIFSALRYVPSAPCENCLIKGLQSYLPSYHGCNASIASSSHGVLSQRHGILSSMVRILVVRGPSHSTLVVLHLPARHKFSRPN